uniref:NADH dehydrogenase subunit 2 n=1 Tax=Cichlidogyrus mbirizei TaxID=2094302 RepID=A0A344ANV5_9PLAT|nr:NADH dehydrogenase subunit 2 [Cichlidogyrus mbirizei]
MNFYYYVLSAALTLASLSWPSFLGVWISMEAANLIVLAGFFTNIIPVQRYVGMLGAVLVSGLSSALLFICFLCDQLVWVVLASLSLKVGMFPFLNWVVVVLVNSPWLVFYFLSTVSKISLLYFSFALASLDPRVVGTLFLLTFFFLIFYLVDGLSGFKMLIAISSISTGSLIIVLLSVLGISSAATLLGVYLFFSGALVGVLTKIEPGLIEGSDMLVASFVMLGIPFSVGVFYKLVGSYYACFLSLPLAIFWVVYSCLELVYMGLWLFEKSSVNEIW